MRVDRDRADCTVRALARVAGIPYEQAFAVAAAAGRRPNSGMHSSQLHAFLKRAGDQGLTFRKVRGKPKSIYKFLQQHPTGRFYCRRSSHAFCIIDGEVFNEWQGDRVIIRDAWELLDSVPATDVERLLKLCPVTLMDAACELDITYRKIQGLSLTLIRQGRARWFRHRLVKL